MGAVNRSAAFMSAQFRRHQRTKDRLERFQAMTEPAAQRIKRVGRAEYVGQRRGIDDDFKRTAPDDFAGDTRRIGQRRIEA